MRLVFLGTSAGAPSLARNVSCIALDLMQQRQAVWLFDCGDGSQRQLLRSGLKYSKLEKIFITHLHGDHCFGLAPLLTSISLANQQRALTVYGPVGIKQLLQTSFAITQSKLNYELQIVEIDEGVIFADAGFKVLAYRLKHRCESFGFRIVEQDHPGKLLADKLKTVRAKPGAWLQQLKQGMDVRLADGTELRAADYLTTGQVGKIIAIFGDTAPTEQQLLVAANADVVVHEATYGAALAEKAATYGHSTSRQTAQMAQRAQAKQLILTHISARYNKAAAEKLLQQAKQVFPNSYLAHDLAVFEI